MWYNGDIMGIYDDQLNIYRLFTYEKWLVNAVVDLTIKSRKVASATSVLRASAQS